jgi:phosphatidylserine decarboxylase
MVAVFQLGVIALLGVAVALCIVYFPYPSPWLRPLLPPRRRWPESQIRGWLQTGRFHPRYLAYFYRDPERRVPPGDDILAPADGVVTSVAVRAGIRYIEIALSFWDMHVQRSPLAGEVVCIEDLGATFTDGEGANFAFLREKFCPVQNRIVLKTPIGEIAIRLITSVAARRLEAWVEPGEPIARGRRIGRILLGSTVVLELAESHPVTVARGQRVRAGETVVAHSVRRSV